MKKWGFLLIFVCFVRQFAFAQYNEIGVFVGGANPVSDIGKAMYINPTKWAFGLLYKRNINKHFSLRADVKWLSLWDNDAYSDISARQNRGFSFENKINEIGVGIEYDFLHFDTHEPFSILLTPYWHTGIYYFKMDNLYFPDIQQSKSPLVVEHPERVESWAIPFTLGVKSRLGNTRFLVGAEMSLRYTFTNNLDGSKSRPTAWFGNLNSNDWYFVSGVYVTYTFGTKKCQCFNF